MWGEVRCFRGVGRLRGGCQRSPARSVVDIRDLLCRVMGVLVSVSLVRRSFLSLEPRSLLRDVISLMEIGPGVTFSRDSLFVFELLRDSMFAVCRSCRSHRLPALLAVDPDSGSVRGACRFGYGMLTWWLLSSVASTAGALARLRVGVRALPLLSCTSSFRTTFSLSCASLWGKH